MNLRKITRYDFNPDLSFIKKDYPGNAVIDGVYQNDEYRHQPSWAKLLQWGLSPNPQREEKKQDNFELIVSPNRRFLYGTEDTIVWLGHSSFFIRLNGVQMLIDPCLENIPFYPRKAGLPCKIDDIRNIDYILISHGHRDHCDLPSLKKILANNPKATFLTALGMSSVLKSLKNINLQEAGWYQQFKTNNIEITFLPAKHWHCRYLHDMDKALWGSFYIKAKGKTFYFAGDTGYGSHFNDIRETMGQPTFCFMPIAAYTPSYIMKGTQVNPLEAIKAFHDLGASHFIPMRYGTYDLSDEPMGEPIQKIRQAFSSKRMNGNLVELGVGESYLVPEALNWFSNSSLS